MLMVNDIYKNLYTGEYLQVKAVGEYKDPTAADNWRKSVVCQDMETQCFKIFDYNEFTDSRTNPSDDESEKVFQKLKATVTKVKKSSNKECKCSGYEIEDYINFDNKKEN